jgi:hypothetical protein
MATESVPCHGYGCGDGSVYARARYVTLIKNAHANCRSTARASKIEGSWQSIVAQESGSANGGGHGHDCGHGSWQMLAAHTMRPSSAQQQIGSSLEARSTVSCPRMGIVTAVNS